MTTKMLISLLLTQAALFLCGMYFGGVVSLNEMKKMGSGIHTFIWFNLNMPQGWLWWAAFVILGTVWITKS